MKASIAVLPGDGVGPEVIHEAVRCLERIAALFGHQFVLAEAAFGGVAIDAHADPLPDETLRLCLRTDAVLLGAVGGPKWDTTDPNKPRPEQGLLGVEVVRRHPRSSADGRRGRPQRPGSGVVEGLDHGPPTLTVRGWGT